MFFNYTSADLHEVLRRPYLFSWTKKYLSSWSTLAAMLVLMVAFVVVAVVHKSGADIDRAAARKVSDSFMSLLASNHVDDAIREMDSPVLSAGREQVEAQLRKLFDYCGRPLDSEFKHDESGYRVYATGRPKPMRKFYYAAATTQYQKGVCFFAIEVVPDGNDMRVASFGPMKLLSGQLPDYLQ